MHRGSLFIVLRLTLALLPIASAGASTDTPPRVRVEVTLENGDWYPLSVEDMKTAAADAALAEISQASLLELVEPSDTRTGLGSLALDLSLIGKAETAQMTVTLALPKRPTFVSNASISVRRLGYREIYRALQHVGRESARRLNAKVLAYGTLAQPEEPRAKPRLAPPELQRVFDDAQRAKHALRFDEARMLFERVAQTDGDSGAALGQMARDELRYGLPAFEAKQSILAMGQSLGEPRGKLTSVARAENLYRQIQAENRERPERIAEAQRALDDLAIARGAMQNAMRSVTVSRMTHLRVAFMEFLMVEGRCPDQRFVDQTLQDMPFALDVTRIEQPSGGSARYAVIDPSTDVEISLVCDRDVRIEDPPARPR